MARARRTAQDKLQSAKEALIKTLTDNVTQVARLIGENIDEIDYDDDGRNAETKPRYKLVEQCKAYTELADEAVVPCMGIDMSRVDIQKIYDAADDDTDLSPKARDAIKAECQRALNS